MAAADPPRVMAALSGGKRKRLDDAAQARSLAEALRALRTRAEHAACCKEARGVRLELLLDTLEEVQGVPTMDGEPATTSRLPKAAAVLLCGGDGVGVAGALRDHLLANVVAPAPDAPVAAETAATTTEGNSNGSGNGGDDDNAPPAKRQKTNDADDDEGVEVSVIGPQAGPPPAPPQREARAVVVCVDDDAVAVEQGRALAAAEASDGDGAVRFVRADIAAGTAGAVAVGVRHAIGGGAGSAAADVVVAVDSLQRRPLDVVFAAAAACLRPGGCFAAITWAKGSYAEVWGAAVTVAAGMGVRMDAARFEDAYPNLPTVKSVKALCTAHGLEPVKVLRWAGGQGVAAGIRLWLDAILTPCLEPRFAEDDLWREAYVAAVAEALKERGMRGADGVWALDQKTIMWVARKPATAPQ